MQITIDTKHDSPEEIKKAIQFLQSLHGESYNSGPSSDASQSFANLFDAPSEPAKPASDMSSLFDITKVDASKKEIKDDSEWKVVPY